MDSSEPEIAHDFSPSFRVYKDGRVERFIGTGIVPPSLDDPNSNVQSKDIVYSQEANLSCRLYLPKDINPNQKLPLIVYFHGGGFCLESPFSPTYHNYVKTLVAETNVVAVSVDYRLAPEHPLPIAYDDSWTALTWVASHVNGNGHEEWLNCHADFGRVFIVGDSAGGNVVHNMVMRYGQEKLLGIDVAGVVLIHAYFWGKEAIGDEAENFIRKEKLDEFWYFVCPTTTGLDDPLINPATDSNLSSLGCSRVLIIVAENDFLRHRGWYYYEILRKSGWKGEVEIMEAKDEAHVFHLSKPDCQNSAAMLQKIAAFINNQAQA